MDKNTLFKMDLGGFEDEAHIFGYYFKSDKDVTSDYLVNVFIEIKDNFRECICKVYQISHDWWHYAKNIMHDGANLADLKIGTVIAVNENDLELIAEINHGFKYYMLTMPINWKQMSYEDRKYYNTDYNNDTLAAIKESIDYAIEVGLRDSETKPY